MHNTFIGDISAKLSAHSIKAINTTVGKQVMDCSCVCSLCIISDVKVSLIDYGATEVELAFIHLKDSNKANYKVHAIVT